MVAVATEAQARKIASTRINAWTVSAFANNTTNQFTHCAASVPYKSGILLIFAIGRSGWSMGLAKGDWNLNKGARYPLAYRIDSGAPIAASATAIANNQVSVRLTNSDALFALFKHGNTLHVRAAGASFGFSLRDSSRALSVALACAKKYQAQPATASNPFATSPSSSSNPFVTSPAPSSSGSATTASTSSDASLRAEATAIAANVLSSAGIFGFRIVAKPPAGLARFHAVWTAPGLVGTVRINEKTSIDQTALILAAGAGQSCKGAFGSARIPSKVAGALQLRTTCVNDGDPNKRTVIAYTLVTRPGGGSYVFASTESGKASGGAADEASNKILEASAQISRSR